LFKRLTFSSVFNNETRDNELVQDNMLYTIHTNFTNAKYYIRFVGPYYTSLARWQQAQQTFCI